MCQECVDNNFIKLKVRHRECSVKFAKWWIKNEMSYYNNDISKVLEYYFGDLRYYDSEEMKSIDKIYEYVMKTYYPEIFKKFKVYQILK